MCVSLVILVVAVGGLLAVVFSALRLSQSNESTRAADQAVRAILEGLNTLPFEEAYAAFNSDNADDPPSKAAFQALLRVNDPVLADQKGRAATARVLLPAEMREDLVDPAFGLPRDLDGDGGLDSLDHSGDYRLLPLRVRLEWNAASGSQVLEVATLLRDVDG